jgi:hypothetical protein
VVAGPFHPGGDVAVRVHDTDADDVHERVSRVRVVKDEFAPDDRHPDTVAVIGDTGDDLLEEVAVLLGIEGAEVERVHQGDGAGAHGEDVADDPADACGGTFVGVHVTRMVVALHPDGKGTGVAEPHDRGIVPRPEQHLVPFRRQRLEERFGGSVTAVFAPEIFKAGDLDVGQVASEGFLQQCKVLSR